MGTRKKEKKKTECSHENMMGSYEFDLNKKRKIKKRDRSKNENIDTHSEIIYGSEENIVRSSESHVGNQSLGHYDQLAKQKDEADKERKRRKKKNKEQNKTECTHGNITGSHETSLHGDSIKRKKKKRDRSKNENIDTYSEIKSLSKEYISISSHDRNQSLGHYNQLSTGEKEAVIDREIRRKKKKKKEDKETECSNGDIMGSYEFVMNNERRKRKKEKRDRSKTENIDKHSVIINRSEENIPIYSKSHDGNKSFGHYNQRTTEELEAVNN